MNETVYCIAFLESYSIRIFLMINAYFFVCVCLLTYLTFFVISFYCINCKFVSKYIYRVQNVGERLAESLTQVHSML